jgi:hypothetical protein
MAEQPQPSIAAGCALGSITFGRTGFLIHGNELLHPGEHLASYGCIVIPKATRSPVSRTVSRN